MVAEVDLEECPTRIEIALCTRTEQEIGRTIEDVDASRLVVHELELYARVGDDTSGKEPDDDRVKGRRKLNIEWHLFACITVVGCRDGR